MCGGSQVKLKRPGQLERGGWNLPLKPHPSTNRRRGAALARVSSEAHQPGTKIALAAAGLARPFRDRFNLKRFYIHERAHVQIKNHWAALMVLCDVLL